MKPYTLNDVTVVMKTYGNPDFTRASLWAFRRYYPKLPVILADGHPHTPTNLSETDLMWVPDGACEECVNAAFTLVRTPLMLMMDNDTKVIGKEALPLLLDTLSMRGDIAASGWYGMVVIDWKKRRAFVGTEYTGHMNLSATQGAFSLHRMDAYREVGGMPLEPFYKVPERLWKGVYPTAGFGGDLTLCTRYRDKGWAIVSPEKGVPVLHWGQAVEWNPSSKGKSPFDKWWFAHVHHTRCNPLNKWRTLNA